MNEFQPKLVLDSRINDSKDKIDIAVERSAAQSTYQPFRSVNSSNSSITFNVNFPSENIAIDLRILIQTDLNFEVNITGATTVAGDVVFQWGKTDGLGHIIKYQRCLKIRLIILKPSYIKLYVVI
jgi:hypothetical protein